MVGIVVSRVLFARAPIVSVIVGRVFGIYSV